MIEGKIYTYQEEEPTVLVFAENNIYLLVDLRGFSREARVAEVCPFLAKRSSVCKRPICFEEPFHAELVKSGVSTFFPTAKTIYIESIEQQVDLIPTTEEHFSIMISGIEDDGCPYYPNTQPIISDVDIDHILDVYPSHKSQKSVYQHITPEGEHVVTSKDQRCAMVYEVVGIPVPNNEDLFVEDGLSLVFSEELSLYSGGDNQ